jgi:hypothetical protein
MRYIFEVKISKKMPNTRINAAPMRQMAKRRNGRLKISEWRERQFRQQAACIWALKVVFEGDADACEWRDQIKSLLVRELTSTIKSSGLAATAFAVAAYDCAGGSTRANRGCVSVKGVSSPSKVLPLSRRMVCYWRASQDYQRAKDLILRKTEQMVLRDLLRPQTARISSNSTEFSDYVMELEMRKEMMQRMFRPQR